MNRNEISQFFECLGEIWRDITSLEFLMRCAIAKKDGDINLLPQPPYTKDKIYNKYPKSFSHYSFEIITNKFNKYFPEISIPQELINLRDGMAHGIISDINHSGTEKIVKFKESENKSEIKVEFTMPLELERLTKIRQSLSELRRHVMKVAEDEK